MSATLLGLPATRNGEATTELHTHGGFKTATTRDAKKHRSTQLRVCLQQYDTNKLNAVDRGWNVNESVLTPLEEDCTTRYPPR